MMKRDTFAIADVYVPVKRRTTFEHKRMDEIAASMLVRPDGGRSKALGEKTIIGLRVDVRKHRTLARFSALSDLRRPAGKAKRILLAATAGSRCHHRLS